MHRIARMIPGILGTACLALALLAAPVSAQEAHEQTVVNDDEIGAALQGDAAATAEDRAVLERVLATEEARTAAEKLGVDVERVIDASRVAEGERLATAADHARTIEDQLAGGQTISFNYVTVALILLLVIVVILLVD